MYFFFLPRTSVLSRWVAKEKPASGLRHRSLHQTTESSFRFLSRLPSQPWVPWKPGFSQVATNYFSLPNLRQPRPNFCSWVLTSVAAVAGQRGQAVPPAAKAGWWRGRVYGKVTAGGGLTGSYPLFQAMWKRAHFNLPACKMQKRILTFHCTVCWIKKVLFKTKHSGEKKIKTSLQK